MKTSIVKVEKEAVRHQTQIFKLIGRSVTKKEALACLELHEQGDGGNTVGWKFDRVVNNKLTLDCSRHTVLGDSLCDLGRLARDNENLKWCFPEAYRMVNLPKARITKDLFKVLF